MERNHYPSRGSACGRSRKLFELLGEAAIKRLSHCHFSKTKARFGTLTSSINSNPRHWFLMTRAAATNRKQTPFA
jgi:hypothetical protein